MMWILRCLGAVCLLNYASSSLLTPAGFADGQRRLPTPQDCNTGGPVGTVLANFQDQVLNHDCCYLEASRNMCCLEKIDDGDKYICRCATADTCATSELPSSNCPTCDGSTGNNGGSVPMPDGMVTGTDKSLCKTQSTESRTLAYRILGGQEIDDVCEKYAGITAITKEGATCNAVYTTLKAEKDGEMVDTMFWVTLKACVQADAEDDATKFAKIKLGGMSIFISKPNFVANDAGEMKLISFGEGVSMAGGNCMMPACAFNGENMAGEVDLNKCRVVSHGQYDQNDDTKVGLRETEVVQYPVCEGQPEGTLCFGTKNDEALACTGDDGAPVLCKAVKNGEDILIGIMTRPDACPKDKIFVLPIVNGVTVKD